MECRAGWWWGTVSPLSRLHSAGSLYFKCLFTLFQEPLTSAPPSPRTSLPITPPPFPLPPVPTLSEGPRVRNLGTETSPSCPLLQFFQSSSGSVGGGSEKALNHRRIWKWWKRAGWCWKPEVGICPDAARGQECGHRHELWEEIRLNWQLSRSCPWTKPPQTPKMS